MVHNLCIYTDKQYIKLQETPETVPDGETPQTITLVSYEENVDYVKPGDRIEISGIYRAQGVRLNTKMRTTKSVFKTYMDVLSYQIKSQKEGVVIEGQNEENKGHLYNEEKRQKFIELANQENIYQKLVCSLAPSIYENDDVKKGIMCQLFGGSQKNFSQSSKGRFR